MTRCGTQGRRVIRGRKSAARLAIRQPCRGRGPGGVAGGQPSEENRPVPRPHETRGPDLGIDPEVLAAIGNDAAQDLRVLGEVRGGLRGHRAAHGGHHDLQAGRSKHQLAPGPVGFDETFSPGTVQDEVWPEPLDAEHASRVEFLERRQRGRGQQVHREHVEIGTARRSEFEDLGIELAEVRKRLVGQPAEDLPQFFFEVGVVGCAAAVVRVVIGRPQGPERNFPAEQIRKRTGNPLVIGAQAAPVGEHDFGRNTAARRRLLEAARGAPHELGKLLRAANLACLLVAQGPAAVSGKAAGAEMPLEKSLAAHRLDGVAVDGTNRADVLARGAHGRRSYAQDGARAIGRHPRQAAIAVPGPGRPPALPALALAAPFR